MTLTVGLHAALSGLESAQRGLDLTAHNTANVNTEGYTRKTFAPQSRVLAGTGAGVWSPRITRSVDENLQKDLRIEHSTASQLQTQASYYQRLQSLFGRPADNGTISHLATSLAREFEMLAVDPAKSTQQSATVRAGDDLAEQLNRMSDQLQALRQEADQAIATGVDRITDLLGNLANLNSKIVRDEALSGSVADWEDKRDQALLELSGYLDIRGYKRGDGMVSVFTTTGATLLSNTAATVSHTPLTLAAPHLTKAGGDFDGITVDGKDITASVADGELKALIELRDTILPNLQAQLDEFAGKLRDEVNAAHNRGTAFPHMATDLTSSRSFAAPATQTVTLSGGDTRVVLYDQNGDQVSTSTLTTLLGGASGTIAQVATALTGFLGANGSASVNAEGKLQISVTAANRGIAFLDENGTTASDVNVGFDADGDGTIDQNASGFANFFGLNDFYVNDGPNKTWESDIKSSSWSWSGGAATLNFTDRTNGAIYDSVTVGNGATLTSIATQINAGVSNVTAQVVPEGSGFRLRLLHDTGEEMAVTQAGGTALITGLGLEPAANGDAATLMVRSDLLSGSERLSRGRLQLNTDTSTYTVARGDNSIANELAQVFTGNITFENAGGLTGIDVTLGSYSASIVSKNASEAAALQVRTDYQTSLRDALKGKLADSSGVNLDEEIAKLVIYQQAYAAAAKVISTTNQFFQILNDVIR